jgi:RHS repeat-associated protein
MVIDGTTQPAGSYTGSGPLVTIKGSRTSINYCFNIINGNAGSAIKGLGITDFKLAGIECNMAGSYILQNVICNIGQIGSGTLGHGIVVEKVGTCTIKSNRIGTNHTGTSGLGCTGNGIYLADPTAASCIIGVADTAGRENIIAYNNYGIEVKDGDFNRISGNVIFGNTVKAIYLSGTGNNNIPAPGISSYAGGLLSGTLSGSATGVIEAFASNGSQQALQLVGKVSISSSSSWSISVPPGGWTNFVATFTPTSGGSTNSTSELSSVISELPNCSLPTGFQSPEIELISPANFSTVNPLTDDLVYEINSLPTLNYPITDDHFHLILQIAPEVINSSTGLIEPDWDNSTGFDTDPASPAVGGPYTITSLSTYVTAPDYSKNYYWRIGVQYELPFAGHQPVLWSQVYKFTIEPEDPVLPGEDYLTDNNEHTNVINWVYGVSYLDDDKTSEGIAYIDGLGKSRQVQSKMNSTNLIMAVEAVYSVEGGGTVMTLPAPLENEELSARFGYAYNFFDVLDGGNWSDFSTEDFDREIKGSTVNALMTPNAAGTAKGVGNYYSASNTNDYVDAANGYPYAYNVSYKSPLKRPMLSAAGVGADFKMTSGKEFRHFYGSPAQEELDRIYGVDNPIENEKISRSITYDPDGVGSINYTDNEGKLIATALTVCSAPSLNELSEAGMTGFPVKIEPLETDLMDPTTLTKTATSKFFIPCCSVSVDIDYAIDLASFQLNEDVPCQSCRYDIYVKIVNEATGKIEKDYSFVNYSPTASTCGTSPEHKVVINESVPLCGPGNFTIVRTIKPAAGILETALAAYDTYLETNHETLFEEFTESYNTTTNYYVLRQEKVEVPNPTLTSLCKLETFVMSGSTSGSTNSKVGPNAKFNGPTGIVKAPDGKFYIADAGNHTIRCITLSGGVTVLAGSAGSSGSTNATGAAARFNNPVDVAFRPHIGIGSDTYAASVIVADKDNDLIRMINVSTGATTTIASSANGIDAPEGVGIDAFGVIYVASTGTGEIYKINLSSGSAVVTMFKNGLGSPTDVGIASDGTLYVSVKGGSPNITKITTGGTATTFYSSFGGGASPASVTMDPAGNFFVSDAGNHKIYKIISATATGSVVAGTGSSGSTDCSSTLYTAPPAATFNVPMGLYADGTSRIYIADKNNHRIRVADIESCLAVAGESTYKWYPDLVEVSDISTGGYTKNVTNLDGKEYIVRGDEDYKLTGMSVNTTWTSSPGSGSDWSNFVTSYERVNGIDLEPTVGPSKITSMTKYTITAGSEFVSTMAAMDQTGTLFPLDQKNCVLLAVTTIKPSCAEACTGIEYVPSDCADHCEEQQMALKADMDAAYSAMVSSSFSYSTWPGTPSLQMHDLVHYFYPLNTYWLSRLTSTDMANYLDYQAKRMAFEVFDADICTDVCNDVNIGPCETCGPAYDVCVNANIMELYPYYQYFLNYWDDPARNPEFPDFPFNTAAELIHGSGPTAYPDAAWLNNIGPDLLNFLAANISDPDVNTRGFWNIKGGGCPTCQAPASASPVCAAAPPRDMHDFPSILLPLLADMNAACTEEYDGCLQLNGTPPAPNNYLCQQNLDDCILYLGAEPSPNNSSNPDWVIWNDYYNDCQALYTNCTTNVTHPTTVDNVRDNLILATLQNIYSNPSEAALLDAAYAAVVTATSSMSFMELQEYLAQYELQQECIKECENELLNAFNQWLEELKADAANDINQAFITGCYNESDEILSLQYNQLMYHYTLYNYDFANNLIATVPPEGIDYIDLTDPLEYTAPSVWSRVPAHRMQSTYKPTSLYTITASSPDEGSTRYLYDKAGRLRFSQTAEQLARGTTAGYMIFSYIKYDNEYRVIESGEYRDVPDNIERWSAEDCIGTCYYAYPKYSVESRVNVSNFPNAPSYTFEETYVVYDDRTLVAGIPSSAYAQKYLQGRVAKTYNRDATTNQISSVTHYSYDAHGRVMFVVQELPVFGSGLKKYKTIDYVYQGLTSRVDQIIYQKNNVQEDFRHKYTYDDDYRLTKAEVSRDKGLSWLPTSEYSYYVHGPLERTGLGNDIQDMDYVYNINGWLKAINNPLSDCFTNDDGEGVCGTGDFASDVFAEAINYYHGDYKRTGVGLDNGSLTVPQSGTHLYGYAKDLFSGNISSTVTSNAFNLTSMGSPPDNILANAYSYDYLNRLTDVYAEIRPQSFTSYISSGAPENSNFASHITYDANGNIESFVRNTMSRVLSGSSTIEMDDMSYKYAQTTTDFNSQVKKTNNRLAHVNDIAVDEPGLGDIKDQGVFTAGTPSTHNYKYDEKGRIISDVESGIDVINWTASDKVRRIEKSDGTEITFTYNAQQQRLTKKVDPSGSNNDVTTIYTYDASGVLMATYEYSYDAGYKYKLLDAQMYGMGRVGTYNINENLVTSPSVPENDAGQQFFEITDHLGNVRAVVSGEKTGVNATVIQMTDYHAFGMEMQGRSFVSTAYRFGYQGSEKDGDVGSGMYTTQYRALDVRLGRWFTPDPVTHPWQSPYCSMDNNPIALTDVAGLDPPGGGNGNPITGAIGNGSTGDCTFGGYGSSEGAGLSSTAGQSSTGGLEAGGNDAASAATMNANFLSFSPNFSGENISEQSPKFLGNITFSANTEQLKILSNDPIVKVECQINYRLATEEEAEQFFGLNPSKETFGTYQKLSTTGGMTVFKLGLVASLTLEEGSLGAATPVVAGLLVTTIVISVATEIAHQQHPNYYIEVDDGVKPVVVPDVFVGDGADPTHELYTLRAKKDGLYPVFSWGSPVPVMFLPLKAGDIWKIGETSQGRNRYSPSELDSWGVRMQTEDVGSQIYIKTMEAIRIMNHILSHGDLPYGNKMIR